MKEGIDVTGIPGPNPMLGCGIILQMLFYGIWAMVVGIILIVLCLKAENHGNKV
nr:MAG: hypothetical protein [Bacteriophage sp.]